MNFLKFIANGSSKSSVDLSAGGYKWSSGSFFDRKGNVRKSSKVAYEDLNSRTNSLVSSLFYVEGSNSVEWE